MNHRLNCASKDYKLRSGFLWVNTFFSFSSLPAKCYKINMETVHIMTPKLNPWRIILIAKLIAIYLVKKISNTRPHPEADESSQTLTPCFLKIHFNTTFTYMRRSLEGSNDLMFPSENFWWIFISPMCATHCNHVTVLWFFFPLNDSISFTCIIFVA